MPIREESMDLFGSASNNVYSYEKAVSTSAGGSITGNVIDLRASKPANVAKYHLYIDITTAVAGATGIQAKIQHCATSGGSYTDLVTGASVTTLTKGTRILDVVLPANCERYIKAVVTNTGTATAGAVGGNCEAILG